MAQVGESIAFTVEIDIMPEVPADEAKYKGLHVEVEKEEFNQDAYDAALLKLRKQFADVIDGGDGCTSKEGLSSLLALRTSYPPFSQPAPRWILEQVTNSL